MRELFNSGYINLTDDFVSAIEIILRIFRNNDNSKIESKFESKERELGANNEKPEKRTSSYFEN